MGLFRKKSHPAAPARPASQPNPGQPPKAPRAERPAKQPKGLIRGVVDPADFIALRFEMVDLRARLEASEQSKAMVETRLAALDAGNAMARPPHDGGESGIDGEVRHRIAEFEAQLDAVAAAAAAASATAENAAAKAMAAAAALAGNLPTGNPPTGNPVLGNPAPGKPPTISPGPGPIRLGDFATKPEGLALPTGPISPDPTLVARIDALSAMVDAQHAARPDPSLSARVDELMSRIEAAPDPERLVALEERIAAAPDATRLGEIEALIGDLAAKIAEPPPLPLLTLGGTGGTDPETAARLDDISERVGTIDSLAGQLAQLNARVTAQAEVGAQLSNLSDRIGELTNGAQGEPLMHSGADDSLREHVQELASRVEVLVERVESGEARARQTAEHLAVIEQRMNAVSTELTNQVSELGRDIDGFGQYANSNGNGNHENGHGNGNGHPNANGNGNGSSNGSTGSSNGSRPLSAELVAELQAAQVKLAAEQARYEIAFRQDLATLAEHVRRTKS